MIIDNDDNDDNDDNHTDIFEGALSLHCDACKRDLLEGLQSEEKSTSAIILFCSDRKERPRIANILVYCEKPCVSQMEGVTTDRDAYTPLDELLGSTGYLEHWCTMGNHLLRGDFTRESYEKLRDIMIVIAPYALARPNRPFRRKDMEDSHFMLLRSVPPVTDPEDE